MPEKTHIAVEAAAVSFANKATAGGAAAGFLGWFAEVNWIGLIGTLIAITGLLISAYFQYKRDRREEIERAEISEARKQAERQAQEMHEAQIRLLQDQCRT